MKPPPLARVSYRPEDLVTAADTTPEHAKACEELVQRSGGVYNAGPFTPWRYRAEGAPPTSTLVFPGGLGGANWGGTAFDPNSGYVFVATQDVGALGWIEKAREGSPVPYDKVTGSGRGTFDVRIGDANWPCQKPPWGRLTAVNASTGDIAWQMPLGITEQLPAGKQNTGRPVLAGPIVTAGGVLFIASTDDNRFRALDARTGKRTVGDEARAARQRRPDHVSGQRTASSTSRSSPPTRWWSTRCRERVGLSDVQDVTTVRVGEVVDVRARASGLPYSGRPTDLNSQQQEALPRC